MGVLDSTLDAGASDVGQMAHQPQETTGFFENVVAGFRAARAGPASTNAHQSAFEAKYYDQIIKALNARGHTTRDQMQRAIGEGTFQSRPRPFLNPYTGNFTYKHGGNPVVQAFINADPTEMEAIWRAVAEERKRDPGFMKDLPDPTAVSARAVAWRQRVLEETGSIYERAGTLGTIGSFLGGFGAAPFEPESYVGGPVTGAGKTVGRTILKRAAEGAAGNVAGGVVALPGIHVESERLGQERTLGDDVKDVAVQAAFGAAFGAGVEVAPKVGRKAVGAAKRAGTAIVDHTPAPIRNAAAAASLRAGTVADRSMLSESRRSLAPYTVQDRATPDEKAAMNVLEHDADIKESSPFHPENAPEHENRLSAVMQSLGIEEVPPPLPRSAPLPRVEGASPDVAPPPRVARTLKAEGTARNPDSTAIGPGQFVEQTWFDMMARHGPADVRGQIKRDARGKYRVDNPAERSRILGLRQTMGAQMTAVFDRENAAKLKSVGLEDSDGNVYLSHFLGFGGARSLLRAAPDTPVSQLLPAEYIRRNRRVLEGKSAGQVIAWAHQKMGVTIDAPAARADAVPEFDPQDDLIPDNLPPIEHRTFGPGELHTDAALMQYKAGGDAAGVTDRLQGVGEWNPLLSGKVIVWEGADGRNVIVDGHQRLGLAKRLSEQDPDIRLDAVVLREADGVTAQQARVMGALKNIAEGTGSILDAARVLRDAPHGAQMLPPRAPNVRAARGLASLSYEAFGAALNDVIDPSLAAVIGRVAPDRPDVHMALVDLLNDTGARTQGEAESVVRQALADDFGTASEEQLGLFGDRSEQQSLYGPMARIMETAKKRLRAEKRSFKTLTDDASRIEQAGNVLDRSANEARVLNSDTAIAILDATAHSAGPVRSALADAARAYLAGDRTGAVGRFLTALDAIDLRAAARGVEQGGPDGGLSVESRSALDDPEADAQLLGDDGPGLFDQAVAAADETKGFSEPTGDAAKTQTDMVAHDILADLPELDANDARTFRVDEEGGEHSLSDIINEADDDINAVEAAKRCLKPGGGNEP